MRAKAHILFGFVGLPTRLGRCKNKPPDVFLEEFEKKGKG